MWAPRPFVFFDSKKESLLVHVCLLFFCCGRTAAVSGGLGGGGEGSSRGGLLWQQCGIGSVLTNVGGHLDARRPRWRLFCAVRGGLGGAGGACKKLLRSAQRGGGVLTVAASRHDSDKIIRLFGCGYDMFVAFTGGGRGVARE